MSHLAYGVGLCLSLAIVSNMWISHTSHHPNIVRVTSSIGIVNREAMGNLSEGVWLAVSLTLAIEATVSNSSISSNMAIAIVNTSDYPTIGSTIGHLAHCVGVTVTIGTGEGKKDKCKSSHGEQSG